MTVTDSGTSSPSLHDEPIVTDGDIAVESDVSRQAVPLSWLRGAVGSESATVWLFGLSLYSYSRGFITTVQIWGEPFFFVDYSSGPIKRGLIGQLFDVVFDRGNVASITRSIAVVHLLLALLVMYVVTHAPRRASQAGSSARLVLNLGILLFATSQFLPTMAFNVGYFDVYLYAAIAVAGLVLSKRAPLATGILVGIAVLIHESVMFLYLPVVLLHLAALRSELADNIGPGQIPTTADVRYLLRNLVSFGIRLCLLPFGVAVGIYLLHSNEAAANEIAFTGAPADIQEFLIQVSFGQTFSSAFTGMLDIWGQHTLSGVIGLGYYSIPSVLMLTLYLGWRRPHWIDGFALTVSSLFPLTILFIAWDLSRFAVATQLSTIISILFWERRFGAKAGHAPPRWWPLLLPVAAVQILVPFTYSYFGSSYVINGETSPGFVGEVLLELFN